MLDSSAPAVAEVVAELGAAAVRSSEAKANRPPLLVFADDWGRHPSSCQHLIRRLHDEYPVLWANSIGTRKVKMDGFTFRRGLEKLKSWNKGVTKVGEQMHVVDLPMLPSFGTTLVRGLNRRLVTSRLKSILRHNGLADPIVLTTLPYIAGLIRNLPRRAFIYYCTDDFSHWPDADREALQSAEQETLTVADMVLAVSDPLVERFSPTGKCHYFPHGADIEHFASTAQAVPPAEIDALPHPRIGFFGLIYEKIDFELLAAVAHRFASGSLVLIGPQDYCPDWFKQLPNVHFMGPRPYAELPQWLSGLDVLLMPYDVNDEMIRQSDPLKLRECLATGKPTVSIDIPEVRHYQPGLRVAASHVEFVQHVESAVIEASDPTAAADRRHSVRADGWDHRAADLRGWLSELQSAAH
jgi:glycosyltransferase involved in cell wall biosynthesis